MKRYTYITLLILLFCWAIPCGLTFGQTPFGGVPRTIPGVIQIEDYDLGGEGVGYHEIDNYFWASSHRVDASDIEDCADVGGGYLVATFTTGEWLKYTVNVTSGTYNLNFRVATPWAGSQVKVYLDNVLIGTMNLPQTGAWENWQTVTLNNITISGGNGKILRLEPVTPDFDFNWMEFVSSGPSIPVAPTALTSTVISGSQINLSWTDNSNNEDGFKIEQKIGAGTFTQIATVGANVNTYNNTGLAAGTTYTYRVSTYNSAGNSAYTPEVQAATQSSNGLPIDNVAAYYPFNGNANDVSGNGKNGTNTGAVLTSDRLGKANAAYFFDGKTNVIKLPKTILPNNTSYAISLWIKPAGNHTTTDESQQLVDLRGQYYIQIPYFQPGSATVPNSVRFGTMDASSVRTQLMSNNGAVPVNQWIHIVANYSNNIQELYLNGILVKSASAQPAGPASNANNTLGKDVSTANQSWFYGVMDEVIIYKRGLTSGEVQALYNRELNTSEITELYNPPLPAAPTGLAVSSVSKGQMILTWTDNSTDETGFTIERRVGASGNFTVVATTATNTTTYTDNNTIAGTSYTYRVAAINAVGSSGYTSEVQASSSTYTVTPGVAQYNGNISGIQWKSASAITEDQATDVKEYDYYYDALNRITASQYQNKSNTTYTGTYDEGNFTYDLNGNLMSLKRSGYKSGVPEVIDNLAYSYGTGNTGNQLSAISDAADKNFGFIDKHTGDNDYSYDANGNLTKDLNKGIDNISYNILNLPCKIASGSDSIVYTYDATGVKLGKKVYKAGVLSTTIDYNGELEFYNHLLKYVHTEEGLVEYNTQNSSFTYEYFLKDHLGNTRAVVSADDSGNLVIGQATSYYPFGMAFTGTTVSGNMGSDNKYQYNGKELQDETLGGVRLDWLDYGARFYDPQIGRWHTQDAFSEKYFEYTPYHYAANNPVNVIDINGDSIWYQNNDGKIVYDAKINSQEEFEKAGIEGTFIGQTFVGRDQDDAMFSFNKDGTTEKSEITATAASKAISDKKEDQEDFLNSMVGIKSTLVDDGKKNGTSKASFGLAIALFADDASGIGVLDDPVAVGALVVGSVAALWAGHATYEFAAEHISNKQAKNWDKHTKPRSGRPGTKNREKPDWKQNPNKKK